MRRFSLLSITLAGIALVLLQKTSPVAAEPERTVLFNRDIRPILSDNCYLCHGPAKATRKADLRFDTEEGAFADLGGYRAIVPGKVKDSHLWQRITSADLAKRMPPPKSGRKLTARQIDLLRLWIEQGAKWERHWSLLSPRQAPLPAVRNAAWPRNPVDRFILARLEQEKLPPAPEAARETLMRRLSFDLTGMPATVAEVDAFLQDTSADAYDKVVERLLASPRYGERMVLDWLDAARYSDTNGYQTDGTRAMWPWRDWVIDAFNKNVPFDRFTVEQIAGDMLPGATVSQKIATGFHRNHMLNGEGGRIAEESRVDYVVDRVDTTFTVWLGLTAGCGRCHDHKYDPISQKDYYRLYAYFNNVSETGGVDRRNSTAAPTLELPTEDQQKKIAAQEKIVADREAATKLLEGKLLAGLPEWEKSVKADTLPEPVRAALKADGLKRTAERKKAVSDHYLGTFPERQTLRKELEKSKKALTDLKNSVLITMVMEERKEPRETFVLERGIYNKYGAKVSPGLPAALPPLPKDAPNNRLGLARWLVDKNNPLTARVTVNRYWQIFFGTGLVKTTEDFGAQGEAPSHPELLDWLAVEFMKDWNVKRIHKLIVTSAAYRQSSQVTGVSLEKDPDNRLLSRGPRLRLSPFALRDQALALGGLLVEKVGGPPVRPYQPPGLWEDFSFNQIRYTQDKGESLYRRSLYTFWRRSISPPNMFDTSARQVCTVRQGRTNTPLHALVLLNDVTFVEAARAWGQRLIKDGGKTPDERLSLAFRMATARRPTAAERSVLVQGYRRVLGQFQAERGAALKLVSVGESRRDPHVDVAELAAHTAVLNMILNLDEVLTKE
jgi:hypothetical protein